MKQHPNERPPLYWDHCRLKTVPSCYHVNELPVKDHPSLLRTAFAWFAQLPWKYSIVCIFHFDCTFCGNEQSHFPFLFCLIDTMFFGHAQFGAHNALPSIKCRWLLVSVSLLELTHPCSFSGFGRSRSMPVAAFAFAGKAGRVISVIFFVFCSERMFSGQWYCQIFTSALHADSAFDCGAGGCMWFMQEGRQRKITEVQKFQRMKSSKLPLLFHKWMQWDSEVYEGDLESGCFCFVWYKLIVQFKFCTLKMHVLILIQVGEYMNLRLYDSLIDWLHLLKAHVYCMF